jgi:hypothetical protein
MVAAEVSFSLLSFLKNSRELFVFAGTYFGLLFSEWQDTGICKPSPNGRILASASHDCSIRRKKMVLKKRKASCQFSSIQVFVLTCKMWLCGLVAGRSIVGVLLFLVVLSVENFFIPGQTHHFSI